MLCKMCYTNLDYLLRALLENSGPSTASPLKEAWAAYGSRFFQVARYARGMT
jgi:hypothetical protein